MDTNVSVSMLLFLRVQFHSVLWCRVGASPGSYLKARAQIEVQSKKRSRDLRLIEPNFRKAQRFLELFSWAWICIESSFEWLGLTWSQHSELNIHSLTYRARPTELNTRSSTLSGQNSELEPRAWKTWARATSTFMTFNLNRLLLFFDWEILSAWHQRTANDHHWWTLLH